MLVIAQLVRSVERSRLALIVLIESLEFCLFILAMQRDLLHVLEGPCLLVLLLVQGLHLLLGLLLQLPDLGFVHQLLLVELVVLEHRLAVIGLPVGGRRLS